MYRIPLDKRHCNQDYFQISMSVPAGHASMVVNVMIRLTNTPVHVYLDTLDTTVKRVCCPFCLYIYKLCVLIYTFTCK